MQLNPFAPFAEDIIENSRTGSRKMSRYSKMKVANGLDPNVCSNLSSNNSILLCDIYFDSSKD